MVYGAEATEELGVDTLPSWAPRWTPHVGRHVGRLTLGASVVVGPRPSGNRADARRRLHPCRHSRREPLERNRATRVRRCRALTKGRPFTFYRPLR